MFSFADLLVVIGLFALRVGVPLAIMALLVYGLKRLDRRWEMEARAQQKLGQPEKVPGEQPAIPQRTPRPMPRPLGVDVPGRQVPVGPVGTPQYGVLAGSRGRPCWDVKGCAEANYRQCAAFQHPDVPCWQARLQAGGKIPDTCPNCEIFQSHSM